MPPTSPCSLVRGHEPNGAALALAGARHCFRIGRPDLIEGGEPVTRRNGSPTERECHLRADPAKSTCAWMSLDGIISLRKPAWPCSGLFLKTLILQLRCARGRVVPEWCIEEEL